MSNTLFLESHSDDPFEQAIARQVQQILNNTALSPQQRENLVRRAQRDLTEHRRRKLHQHQLVQQISRLQLPKGFQVQSIQVRDGQVQVAVLNHRNSFVWLEAGEAPSGVPAHLPSFVLPRPPRGAGPRVRKDGIAERRKAAEARKT